MKIVDRKTFLALPPDTVYAKFEPHFFGPLTIKCKTIGKDWYYQALACAVACDSSIEFNDKMDAAVIDKALSLPMDFNDEFRDGLFDENQLFAVFEDADVEALVDRLRLCF